MALNMSSTPQLPALNGDDVEDNTRQALLKHSRSRSDSSLMHFSDDDLNFEDPLNEAFVIPMRRVSSIPSRRSGSWLPNTSYRGEGPDVAENDADMMDLDSDEDLSGTADETMGGSVVATADRPSTVQLDFLDTPVSTVSPIPLRRVVSSPTKKLKSLVRGRSFRSPSKETTPASNTSTKQVQWDTKDVSSESILRTSPLNRSPLAAPYPMRRHNSLPMRPFDRLPGTPQIQIARTDSSSSSEATSEEEILQLASTLASPISREKGTQRIFRSLRRNSYGDSMTQTSSQGMNGDSHSDCAPYIRECRTDSFTESRALEDATINSKDSSTARESKTGVISPTNSQSGTRRRHVACTIEEGDRDPAHESLASSSDRDISSLLRRNKLQYVLYLSVFAMFGSIIRVYLARIFGFDCEFPDAVNDFLSPLSTKVCVTATGRTLQRGGALFVDLPANMFGSFIMGLMTSLAPDIWPPLPWLRDDHPLQGHDALHVAIKTGLCGSLTTFASWNAQMIVMLDGTATELGSQIVPALVGYLLGLYCAVASFLFGTHVSTWLNRWKRPNVLSRKNSNQDNVVEVMEEGGAGALDLGGQRGRKNGSENSKEAQSVGKIQPFPTRIMVHRSMTLSRRGCHLCKSLSGPIIPFVTLAVLLTLFICGDVIWGIFFYRRLWMAALITPPGTLLRWTLAKLNYTWFNQRLEWVPWGTVAANLLGSAISVLLLAVETRHFSGDKNSNVWLLASVGALRVGFAGSLSTVSTFVKELVDLTTQYPHHAKAYYYATGTIFAAIILGICVYTPVVRGW